MKPHNANSFTSCLRSLGLLAGPDPKRSRRSSVYDLHSRVCKRPRRMAFRADGASCLGVFTIVADSLGYRTELTARWVSRACPSEEAENARGLAQASVAALGLIHRGISAPVRTTTTES